MMNKEQIEATRKVERAEARRTLPLLLKEYQQSRNLIEALGTLKIKDEKGKVLKRRFYGMRRRLAYAYAYADIEPDPNIVDASVIQQYHTASYRLKEIRFKNKEEKPKKQYTERDRLYGRRRRQEDKIKQLIHKVGLNPLLTDEKRKELIDKAKKTLQQLEAQG